MDNTAGFEKTKRIIIGLIDIIIFHFSIYLSFLLRYNFNIPINYAAYEEIKIYILIIFVFMNILFGIYIFYNKTLNDLVVLTIIIQVIMSIVIMATTFFGRHFAFPRTVIFIAFLISTLLLSIWRCLAFLLYLNYSSSKRVMIVGTEDQCLKAAFNFNNAKNKRHKVTKIVTNNYYKNIILNIDEIDVIYLIDNRSFELENELFYLVNKNDKKLFLETNFQNLKTVSPNVLNIDDESILELTNFKISPENDLLKRLIDFSVSLLILFITSPIFIITAILIKITSPGPIFYKQVRITRNEKEFNILKFRTMTVDAETRSGPVLATANDTRITKVGKYLRSLRIDELPQLINVLKGDMALVGPRPERPFFVNKFKEETGYYTFRHHVRAGITGYAQVYGKYASDYQAKLKFDLTYIKDYSLLFDIKILFQTIKILFDKISSQGVEDEFDNFVLPDDIEIYN